MLRAAIFALIPIALAGCGASAPLPQTQDAAAFQQQAKKALLCIKLDKGDADPKTPEECSGKFYKHKTNSNLCYPTHPDDDCLDGPPEKATVLLTEKLYKGKIVAATSSAKLPKAVLNNPAYPGALCGDKGTASYSEDVLDVQPSIGRGPTRKFTIEDYGPRSVGSAVAVSSACSIIFYDKSYNVVPFVIVMFTIVS
jgi:hypothetical protein